MLIVQKVLKVFFYQTLNIHITKYFAYILFWSVYSVKILTWCFNNSQPSKYIPSTLVPNLNDLQTLMETFTLLTTDCTKIVQKVIKMNIKKFTLMLMLQPSILNIFKSCWTIFYFNSMLRFMSVDRRVMVISMIHAQCRIEWSHSHKV